MVGNDCERFWELATWAELPAIDRVVPELFADTGVLLALAGTLIVLLLVLLPAGSRRLVREPVVALAICAVLSALHGVLPRDTKVRLPFESLALFALLCSVGRSVFLLAVKSVVGQWLVRPLPRIMLDVIQGVIYVAALLVTLDAAGVPATSLFTGSALITAVIGLSMRDTLGNVFAGLAIQAQRPFDVGDWIQFDERREHVGRVVEINWRATRVMTLDEVEVIIPNSTLAQAPIRNFTKPEIHSRRSVVITAPYEVPTRRMHRLILDAIADAWGVLKSPPPTVVTHAFSDSGIEYWVRFFTNEFAGRDRVDGGVRDRIWYAMARAGISFPFPHRQLQIEQVTHEVSARAEEVRTSERRQALRGVDFLQSLPDAFIERLAVSARRRGYAEGEVIIRQGDRGSEFFIILNGEVAVSSASSEGNGVELSRLRSPQFFGEMSCLTGQPRSATVKATEDCEVLVISKTDLSPILAESPELAEHISETLTIRQLDNERRAASLGSPPPRASERRRDLLKLMREFFALG